MSRIIPRFDFRVQFEAVDDVGKTRSRLEDAHLCSPDLAVFAVADGMGGHPGGDVASGLAVRVPAEFFGSRSSQRVIEAYAREPNLERRRAVLGMMRQLFTFAHERLLAEVERRPSLRGMGTTLDVVCLVRDKAFVAHAGDGRVYLARPNAVIQLTQDHVEFELLKARGLIAPGARGRSSGRLLNAVGLGQAVLVDTLFVDLRPSDRLLLCSDGVHGQLESEARLGELLRYGDASEAATNLVLEAGELGRDNATALVIDICERFVAHDDMDRGPLSVDLRTVGHNPLFEGLSHAYLLSALSAAIELDLPAGETVPQAVASDLVSYIVLDGLVELAPDRRVGAGALLFPESLVRVGVPALRPKTLAPTRVLRVRGDDFREVCDADHQLGAQLYRRVATYLARNTAALTGRLDGSPGAEANAAIGEVES